MEIVRYEAGAEIYRAEQAADGVFLVRCGAVAIALPGEAPRCYGAGTVFGGRHLLSARARGERAWAHAACELVVVRRGDLLEALESDPALVAQLVGALAARRGAPAPEVPPRAAAPAGLHLRAAAPRFARDNDLAAIEIQMLPFRVGRRSGEPEAEDAAPLDLALPDYRPYQLSRRHFRIELRDGALWVRDTGSHHGTIVNGEPIGAQARSFVARLVTGDNEIVAGRRRSPFRFVVTVTELAAHGAAPDGPSASRQSPAATART